MRPCTTQFRPAIIPSFSQWAKSRLVFEISMSKGFPNDKHSLSDRCNAPPAECVELGFGDLCRPAVHMVCRGTGWQVHWCDGCSTHSRCVGSVVSRRFPAVVLLPGATSIGLDGSSQTFPRNRNHRRFVGCICGVSHSSDGRNTHHWRTRVLGRFDCYRWPDCGGILFPWISPAVYQRDFWSNASRHSCRHLLCRDSRTGDYASVPLFHGYGGCIR